MGIDFVPTGVATGVAGALTGKEVVTSMVAATASVIAAGLYAYYAVGANVSLQVQDSTGTWNNVTAVGVGGLCASDGTNFRFNNAGGGTQTVTTIKIG